MRVTLWSIDTGGWEYLVVARSIEKALDIYKAKCGDEGGSSIQGIRSVGSIAGSARYTWLGDEEVDVEEAEK